MHRAPESPPPALHFRLREILLVPPLDAGQIAADHRIDTSRTTTTTTDRRSSGQRVHRVPVEEGEQASTAKNPGPFGPVRARARPAQGARGAWAAAAAPGGLGPDPTDAGTVLALAQMTRNAYVELGDPRHWIDIPGYNVTDKFGWDAQGIRGYIYESVPSPSTGGGQEEVGEGVIVIVIKGTSLALPLGSGPTARTDKLNDNMMFSCCCARTSWSGAWGEVCDCPLSATECSLTCLQSRSSFGDSYYNVAQTIYLATREYYPRAKQVWMTGHSLGGALASLVALTNDLSAFTFEAPGEMLFAGRIGLLPTLAPGAGTEEGDDEEEEMDEFLRGLDIHHYGNVHDPIFMGQCYGLSSSCYWFSYVLESKCHAGWECTYTQRSPPPAPSSASSPASRGVLEEGKEEGQGGARGRVDVTSIQSHSIQYVIDHYLQGAPVPECTVRPRCRATECDYWNYTRTP